MNAQYHGSSKVIQKITAVALAAGALLRLSDGRAAVLTGINAPSANDEIGQQTRGLFKIDCASATTFSVGDPVVWDASAAKAVAYSAALDGSADFYLGTAAKAKASGELTVLVDLNACYQRLRPFVFEFDTETDTDVHTLIPAYMNPTGLQILSVIGIVTEQFGGASQDQGIVTVKDTESSPNTLCTLTPSDAGADAVGDVIQGAGAANAILSATGVAVKTVAAGKGVTGTVTQAVSGSGAAGKMKVYILALPLA